MASPILMQNENLTKELSKSKVGRSAFNLSHSKTFPMYIGAMYPCMCLPTMPTESVEINCTALLKQLSPLTVPLMADLKLNTAFYWVDYRLAWKKFERFMQGGRTGNETYDLPKYGNSDNELPALADNTMSLDLRTYLGITKNSSSVLPEALPFFAYQMICRDFYTNVDRLAETNSAGTSGYTDDNDWCYNNLFPANPDEFRLSDGVQSSVNGVQINKIRYHEFRPDYFLSSTYAPMRGDPPAINLDTSTQITSLTADRLHFDNSRLDYDVPVIITGPDNKRTYLDATQNDRTFTPNIGANVASAYTYNYPMVIDGQHKVTGSTTNYNGSLSGVTFTNPQISGLVNASVTAAQLTWLNQLTTYKELNVLCKPYYKDFLNAHFDSVRIGEEQTERPVYIGGSSQRISISEVTQVSQSTDTSPIGTVGAKAGSLDSNNIGQFFCNDYGVIIGIAYIVPDVIYEPALPRWLTRETNLDFYSPEFANLSMQAILNREFFVSSDSSWNNSALGYQGAFDELRSMPNQVAGDLLNDNMQDLQHYVLLRKFDNNNKPELTHEFLSMRNNIDYSAWALGDTVAPFIGQFANYVNAIMPMPYVAVPKH